MPFCSNCGSWIDKGLDICPNCGLNPNVRLEVGGSKGKKPYDIPFCSNCGSWIDKGLNICPNCGLNPNVREGSVEEPRKIPYDLSASKLSTSTILKPLEKAIIQLTKNPGILVLGFLFYALQAPSLIVESLPFAVPPIFLLQSSLTVFLILIGVFFAGGMLGIAKELFHKKRYSLDTFLREGKKNYVRLFIGLILHIIIISSSAFLSAMIIAVVASILSSIPLMGLFFALIGVAFSIIVIVLIDVFLKFYGIIIVADGLGVIDSFKKSYFFVRMNFGNVVCYYAISFAISTFIMLPVIIVYLGWFILKVGYSTTVTMSLGYRILPFILMLFLGPLSYAISVLYNSQFYLSLTRKR